MQTSSIYHPGYRQYTSFGRRNSIFCSNSSSFKPFFGNGEALRTSANKSNIGCSPKVNAGTLLICRNTAEFRPCIDLHQGKVKQIVGSTLSDKLSNSESLITNFETEKSPAEYAELYKNDGLTGGHVIMLGADEKNKQAAFKALHAYPGGLQLGGGVTPQNAREYLDAGASHIIVTSFIFTDGKLDFDKLMELVEAVGKNRVVIDLSCRRKTEGTEYYVVTHRWQKFTDFAISERALENLSQYADEFLVHGVDVEGKQLGVDEELVSLLGKWSPIPVTYAGGVSTLLDLDVIASAGSGRVNVTVGSALDIFGGKLAYTDVVKWHKQHHMERSIA